MTIYELNLVITDYTERVKQDRKDGVTNAFYAAYFAKHEKLSGADLEKVLDGIDNPQNAEMTTEAMLAVVKRLANSGG